MNVMKIVTIRHQCRTGPVHALETAATARPGANRPCRTESGHGLGRILDLDRAEMDAAAVSTMKRIDVGKQRTDEDTLADARGLANVETTGETIDVGTTTAAKIEDMGTVAMKDGLCTGRKKPWSVGTDALLLMDMMTARPADMRQITGRK